MEYTSCGRRSGMGGLKGLRKIAAFSCSLVSIIFILVSNVFAQVADDRNGDDIASVLITPNVSAVADITYSPGDERATWQESIGLGRGNELFLAADFSGDKKDDIATICFDGSDTPKVLTTASPGDVSGTTWDSALRSGNQLTYYFLPGDYNGDGHADIAAFYPAENGNPLDVKVKFTFGPTGAMQTSNAEDLLLPAALNSAFVAADMNGDGNSELIVVKKLSDVNYSTEIYSLSALITQSSFNLRTGTLQAIRAGDFNNDGIQNLAFVFADETLERTVEIVNPTSGQLIASWSLGAGPFLKILSGDFDNDGISDIAAISQAGSGESIAKILRGPSGSELTWNLGTTQVTDFLAGDFNRSELDFPGAPSNLMASDDNVNLIHVSWQAATDAEYYFLYRSTQAGVLGDPLPSAGSPEQILGTNYNDTSAVPGVVYHYTARAFNATGQGGLSNQDAGIRPELPTTPTALSASDDIVAHILVTWNASTNASHYRLYRSQTAGQLGSLLAGSILATSYQDSSATPGITYYYTAQASNDFGDSGLSNQDAGVRPLLPTTPTNLAASDTIVEHIRVTWNASTNATYYRLYRSQTQGQLGDQLPQQIVSNSFNDATATPEVTYYYTVRAFNTFGESGLSNQDAGIRPVLPETPMNLVASDNIEEFIRVTWSASSGADYYHLYRSQFQGSLGAPLSQNGMPLQITATTYNDLSAVPGVTYYYTARAFNSFGQSGLSNTDAGTRPDPINGPDCDGDGVSDEQEIIDGTDPCDPGSFRLHLKSPAFTKYNTFLAVDRDGDGIAETPQNNFLEVMANGTVAVQVKLTVYDINGVVLNKPGAVQTFTLQPLQQRDIDIHSIVDQLDTYGVVKIEWDDTIPGATIVGRMANYRQDPIGNTFSFAQVKELRNPTRGVTYATANSFDPQGQGFLVPNWLELINLDSVARAFTINVYNQEGQLLPTASRQVVLEPLSERDFQAGHEFGEGVYLVEVIPANGAAKYFATVTRYSSNSPGGVVPETYNFAFPVDAKFGRGDIQYAPIANEVAAAGSCWDQTNWLEVTNVREMQVDALLVFRSASGQVINTQQFSYAPRSQFHFNASALLEKGQIGSVEVSATEPGSLLVQSLVYYHDCEANLVQTAYSVPAAISGRDVQGGSYNTFLGMNNLMRIIGTSNTDGEYTLELYRPNGSVSSQVRALGGADIQALNLTDSIFGLASDSVGTLVIRTNSPGQVSGVNIRFRETGGKADFAIPTVIQ